MIRQNHAMVPGPPGASLKAAMNLGFNLNVLVRGVPAFFAKCRAADEPELARSTAIRNCLAGDRLDGLSVSPAGIASSSRMTVQVSRYLLGSDLGKIVVRQSSAAYLGLLRTVLHGNAKLSRIAMSEPGLLKPRPATLPLAVLKSGVVDDMALLSQLDKGEHSSLIAALHAAGEVPARPQHGDFWPPNLLMIDGRVWVLDFDSYGEIRVPLLDDVTFMLGTLGWRAGSLAGGIELFSSDCPEAHNYRGLLLERAEADGVSTVQIEGVIVYYLAQIGYDAYRRAGAIHGAPHVAALRFAARRLASGKSLYSAP